MFWKARKECFCTRKFESILRVIKICFMVLPQFFSKTVWVNLKQCCLPSHLSDFKSIGLALKVLSEYKLPKCVRLGIILPFFNKSFNQPFA